MIDKKLFKSFIYETIEGEEGYDEDCNFHGPERYMENLYANSFKWVIAENYDIVNGQIQVEKVGDYRSYSPVEYDGFADLFSSFTKIGGSERFFDKRILDWVRSHGLLQRRYYEREDSNRAKTNPDRNRVKENSDLHFHGPSRLFLKDRSPSTEEREKALNQASISIEDFRTRVQEAQSAVQLYLYLYSSHFSALAGWIEQIGEQVRLPNQVEEILLHDGNKFPDTPEAMSTNEVMMITTRFEAFLTRQISGVKISLSSSHNSSRFQEHNYAPRRTYRCPDLLTAIWLQFYLAVTERHPLRRCANPNCFTLFFPKRQDQKYCSDGCRSTSRPDRHKPGT